jgi:hypothetical protein
MAKARSTVPKAPPAVRTKRSVPNAATDTRLAQIERELENWRKRAIPDAAAPLDGDDVARLVRDCIHAIGVAGASENFSVNTVHYYRRKDILDEPVGRTAAARYALRHVWQAVGARLAGFLGLVTLAEARDAIRGAPEATLRRFVAARVADARGRDAARQQIAGDAITAAQALAARPLGAAATTSPEVLGVAESSGASATAFAWAASPRATAAVLSLDGDALCLIPSGHAALRSAAAARALVDGLARQLGLTS